jgi:hypothetical protein
MKYVVIAKSNSNQATSREAMSVFAEQGVAEGTVALTAGLDGRTIMNIVETDDPAGLHNVTVTYSPYFDDFQVIPVLDVDDATVASILDAQGNWPS